MRKQGSTVEFGEVLLIGNGNEINVGAPLIKGGKVSATVEKHGKGEKKVIVEIPPPQALPAPGHASPAVHAGQDHGHQRLTIRDNHHGT